MQRKLTQGRTFSPGALVQEQPVWSGMVRVFRAGLRAMRAYRPQSIKAPVLCVLTGNEAEREAKARTWQMHASSVEVVACTAEHMTMLRDTSAITIARQVDGFLSAGQFQREKLQSGVVPFES